MNRIVKENDEDVLEVFERFIVPEINQDSSLSGWDLEMFYEVFRIGMISSCYKIASKLKENNIEISIDSILEIFRLEQETLTRFKKIIEENVLNNEMFL